MTSLDKTCHAEIVPLHQNRDLKQDKVNYAVSEREDRVKDLTTLTMMTGYTGM